jgi:hypothetical protein
VADLLDDMASFLVAKLVGTLWNGSTGTIFLGSMPDSSVEPNAVIVLLEDSGSRPYETMGTDSRPVIEQPRLTVLTRGEPSEYVEARGTCVAAWRQLCLIANETVNGTYYQRVAPLGSPAPLDRDENDRWTFMASFDVMRAVTP